MEPSGRLELTWANKHLRLIANPQGAGGTRTALKNVAEYE